MEKKESANKPFSGIKAPSRGKLKEFFLIILKLLIGISFLPWAYAVSICFSEQLVKLNPQTVAEFIWGIVGFLGIYLFVWEPAAVFKTGQKILEVLFRFFAPLVKAAPYVLPIYSILLFVFYLIFAPFVDMRSFMPALIFGLGFSFALHIVLCAKTLRSKQADKLKAGYIFGFSLIYILDVILLAFFFNIIFSDFSFLKFFNGSYQIVKGIYKAVFAQFFL